MYFLIPFGIVFYIIITTIRYFIPVTYLDGNNQYVFITGAGAGFGEGLSIKLDQLGWNVIAACKSDRSVQPLQSKLSSRSYVFQCDITSEDDIHRAAQVVKDRCDNKLHALVNNAGISGAQAVIDFLPMSEFHKVMNVNLFGQIHITKALSHAIKNAKINDKHYGRIVNVTSVAGIIAPQRFGAYSSSKFAFEAFSDVLRREYLAWNIPVSIVEPGFFGTPMVHNSATHTATVNKDVSEEIIQQWGSEYTDVTSFDICAITAENPAIAVNTLCDAVCSTRPKIRYYPGLQSSLAFYPLSLLPAELVDIFSGLIAGMLQPNQLAPDQPINWRYRVSDKVVRMCLYVFNTYIRNKINIPAPTVNANTTSNGIQTK